jgi:hypothetical protein
MTETLLLAFNGQLNLRNAYNWNRSQVSFFLTCYTKTTAKTRDQVYNFLEDVVGNHANYGVLADRVAELMSIRQHLLRLR